ncbi:alpha-amylase/4-alpha-glucanotransferase domain-containing protein [Aureliella helgolandensis]|uniref:Alpha-amylase 1 n=1 Tax=Aureliella helgolandensis TaxID=2527968 RepID=A0A518G3I3_9BACT|nr:alpha-amylase/4-alpha-glucanotransferase domain-containing protein [Aureliella helgolandensis]QDV23148.1 Alpha-amylase 1 [Aureliella helgolandensis]
MSHPIRLCLVLHNHQPIGNFGDVIEQAYQDSYLPFLDVLEEYDSLQISLHTSGPLMLWLAEHHPEYVQRLRSLVAAKRIEILGGPFYEPILPMLPGRDRVGQIVNYGSYLSETFSTTVQGMWMPERVWESALTADIVRSGIRYTVLDDFHFKAAGWNEEQLTGCFTTEENGSVLRVFPGSERLRYLIPFAPVHDVIEYCRQTAKKNPGATLVFGDDGEKFGTWPDTKAHVYERGWLRRFFDALVENQQWLQTRTLASAVEQQPPIGKVYLPDCSYREMTEWALPAQQQELYQEVVHDLVQHPKWDSISQFLRGGNWRNFKVRYAEANEMYARMMEVSRNLEDARHTSGDSELLGRIEDHLYRGQCNCPYWHGAFGGIYLPHLRNAIYSELIAADNLLEYLEHGKASWVAATTEDYNFDLRPEVRLANEHFAAYIAPSSGGMLYELDVRANQQNILATLQRRPEAYHRQVLQGNMASEGEGGSIHDRVVFKQDGLDQRLQYDAFPRKSFLEHFYDNDVSCTAVATGGAMERGDFVAQPYEAKLRRAATKVQLQLSRDGNAWGIPIRITKALTVEAGSTTIEVAYLLEGLPRDRQLHLALEWNFSGMPAGADDRFFYDASGQSLGHLGTYLDLTNFSAIGLIDQWQGMDVSIGFNRPTALWTFPVETVSQSEAGFELVHQSVCVMPHWLVQGDAEGKWTAQMQLAIKQGHQPSNLAEQVVQNFAMA